MDDTNNDDESKKPIAVTKAAGDKTPRPVKKAAKVATKAKAAKKSGKAGKKLGAEKGSEKEGWKKSVEEK